MISMNEMAALARALVDAEEDTARAQQALKDAKERERVLREETLPSALQELGVEKLTLESGQVISMKQEVYASIPNHQKPLVYKWLDDHGFGGLIKTEIALQFDKDSRDQAVEVYEQLAGEGLSPDLTMNIHAGTLKAFIKEQLAKGDEFPLDLFGARAIFEATVKQPK